MTEEISLDEYRRRYKAPPKYGNKRDGQFDSQSEAARYDELVLLAHAGQITDLRVHPVYELQAAFTDYRGAHVPRIAYEGDFEYRERGRLVCEDVKGAITDVFRLKERLFRFRYPDIELRIVRVK